MGGRLRDRRGHAAPPGITTPMMALAWSIIHCPEDRAECAHLLAKLVIEAVESAA